VDEERVVKAYEEIMRCTERDARCVFMFISAADDELEFSELPERSGR